MSASQKFKLKTEQENIQCFKVLTNFEKKIPWGSKTGMCPLKESHAPFDFFCSEDFEMIGRRCYIISHAGTGEEVSHRIHLSRFLCKMLQVL